VSLTHHKNEDVSLQAIKFTGNISSGDDVHSQAIIDSNYVDKLKKLLENEPTEILLKEVLWTISNITAIKKHAYVVYDANIYPHIKQIMQTTLKQYLQKECIWILKNTLTVAPELADKIITVEVINFIIQIFRNYASDKLVVLAEETLLLILKQGSKFRYMIGDCNGTAVLESLQHSHDDSVYQKAIKILSDYFPEDDEPQGGATGV